MTDPREDDDDPVPRNCTGCGKRVLDGQGQQRERGRRKTERFCEACWKKHCDEQWGGPAPA